MENYEKVRIVGRGAFGTVHLCCRKSDQKLVIMKQIAVDQMTKDERQASLNEAKVLAMLDHPNIIAYYDNFLEDKSIVIVMEYAPGGTLFEFLQQRGNELLPENVILNYFCQIVLALHHVHSRQILHRDLKTQNILLDDKRCIVKVGDFGISKILSSKSKAYTVVGTPCYISPELCEGKPYNQKSDIWALGCVLYELLTLKRPFEANNLPALVVKIMRGSVGPIADHYSGDLKQLLFSMLHLDPNRRPNIREIMAHPVIIGTLYSLYTDIGALPCVHRYTKSGLGSPGSVALSPSKGGSSDLGKISVSKGKKILIIFKLAVDKPNVSKADVCRESESPIALPLPSADMEVIQVAAGMKEIYAVCEGGNLISWEINPENKTASSSIAVASNVTFISRPMAEKTPVKISHIACGNNFSVCLTDRGIVLTFGNGENGCLGHGNRNNASELRIVEALLGYEVISVSAGTNHVMALTSDNEVFAWGCGENGRLGLGKAESQDLPQRVLLPQDCQPHAIFCGHDCSFLIDGNKHLLACGSNRHNKMAMDTEDGHHMDEARVFTPVHSEPLPQLRITKVAACYSHTAVLTDCGDVYTFGSNQYQQLGWGEKELTLTMPGKVAGLEGHTMTSIAGGGGFTITSSESNEIFVWGNILTKEKRSSKKLDLATSRKKVVSLSCSESFATIVLRQ